jgi:IS30 family transposase
MTYKNEYSSEDIVRIKLLIAERKSYREIAEALGRSKGAIVNFCHRNGLQSRLPAGSRPGKDRWKRPYTEDELNRLRHLADLGLSRAFIARVLNRSAGSINGTCAYYGIKTNGGPGGTPSRRVRVQTPGLQSA